jgi:hypothetical protein
MSDGKVVFDTRIDTTGFESGLKSLESSVNSGSFTVGKGIKSMLGAELIRKAGKAVLDFGKDSL